MARHRRVPAPPPARVSSWGPPGARVSCAYDGSAELFVLTVEHLGMTRRLGIARHASWGAPWLLLLDWAWDVAAVAGAGALLDLGEDR